MAKGRRVLWYSREQKNVLESRTPARGGLRPLPCQESFAGKMGVTVHRTWVSKSTYDTLKYRNCSSFLDKNFKAWRCTFVIRIDFKETQADVALLALCPASFSTVWQSLRRPQLPGALLAWAACGSGDSKCFTPLENSLVGSLSYVLICLQSCSKFSHWFSALASASLHFSVLAF